MRNWHPKRQSSTSSTREAKEELLKLKTAKQNVASFFREEEQTQQER